MLALSSLPTSLWAQFVLCFWVLQFYVQLCLPLCTSRALSTFLEWVLGALPLRMWTAEQTFLVCLSSLSLSVSLRSVCSGRRGWLGPLRSHLALAFLPPMALDLNHFIWSYRGGWRSFPCLLKLSFVWLTLRTSAVCCDSVLQRTSFVLDLA